MKSILSMFIVLASFNMGYTQFGFGVTVTNDLYQYYQNPDDDTGESTSAGNALLNLGLGPKIWVGGNDFSISIEAQAVIGMTAFSARDYKGMGTLAYPMMAKLNFGGLSALDKEGKFGWSIGAGIQYSKTEWYGLSNDFEAIGGRRDLVSTYIGQVGYGFGMSGFSAHAFVRYGYNPDNDAKVFSIGVQYDFNAPKLREISDPASEL